MLTLIKNLKNWIKYSNLVAKRVETIDPSPYETPSRPLEYPLLVDSYLLSRGNKYEIRHIICYKNDAQKLLDVK